MTPSHGAMDWFFVCNVEIPDHARLLLCAYVFLFFELLKYYILLFKYGQKSSLAF